jgi:adenylylsulfate kinase-like enzyme
MLILIFGLPGSGKTTMAKNLSSELEALGISCNVLNEDEVRKTYGDFDITLGGHLRQANRLNDLAHRETLARVTIVDSVCPLNAHRDLYKADLLVHMNTVNMNTLKPIPIYEQPTMARMEFNTIDDNNVTKLLTKVTFMLQRGY